VSEAMMIWLRYLLIVAWIGCLIWYANVLNTVPRPRPEWPIVAIPIFCLLNLAYLFFSYPSSGATPFRLVRLIQLWLDAKEAEFRRRAGIEKKNSN
jgi:hypothetical protein